MNQALAWRRLAAFGADYLVIALYIGGLAAFASFGEGLASRVQRRWQAHLLGFSTLTLPVVLYFALSEASSRGGTLGKRVFGLHVVTTRGERLPLGRSLLRSAVKFAPWELSHTALYRTGGWASEPEPLASWQVACFSLSLLWAALFTLSLFFGLRRPLYDLLSGAGVQPSRTFHLGGIS